MTDARFDSQDETGRLGAAASAAFALAAVLAPLAATLLAVLGVSLLVASVTGARRLARAITTLRLTAITIALALAAIVVPQALHGAPPWLASRGLPAIALVFALAHIVSPALVQRLRTALAATLIVVSVVAGSWLIHLSRSAGYDVVLLHESAAAVLARGENPYGDAVTAPNGAPGAPAGSLIVGYPYPPVAALAYAAGASIAGEPRWVSFGCWIVLLISLLHLLRRSRSQSLLPALMLTAFPGWAAMLQSGWTEPLSMALLAVTIALWQSPAASGVALGCALASKQYFIAMLPALARWRDAGWQRRVAGAVIVAVVTLLPAVVWSPADAWRSLVGFHMSTPLRADSRNIAGVLAGQGWQLAPPAWLALLFSVAATAAVPPLLNRAACCRAAALALAVFFLFSRQAMPNYWYLVAVTALLGSIGGTATDARRSDASPAEAGHYAG
jgi:hypothetical protein